MNSTKRLMHRRSSVGGPRTGMAAWKVCTQELCIATASLLARSTDSDLIPYCSVVRMPDSIYPLVSAQWFTSKPRDQDQRPRPPGCMPGVAEGYVHTQLVGPYACPTTSIGASMHAYHNRSRALVASQCVACPCRPPSGEQCARPPSSKLVHTNRGTPRCQYTASSPSQQCPARHPGPAACHARTCAPPDTARACTRPSARSKHVQVIAPGFAGGARFSTCAALS